MGKYLGAVLSLVVAALIVTGAVLALGGLARGQPLLQAADAGTSTVDQSTLKHTHITLQTFPANPYEDPSWMQSHFPGGMDNGTAIPPAGDNQDWVTYWPSTNLVVPAHTLVTITVENYDGKTPLLNPFYARAQGVVGNSITVDGKAANTVDPNDVSHTFTIHSIPNDTQPWLYVSVPITGEADDVQTDDAGFPDKPVVTEFSFITGAPGHYIWQCIDPCGSGFNGFGGPMSTKGYMSGTLTVQ